MATVVQNQNQLLVAVRGRLAKQLVIKQYGDKIVITAYPRKSKKKASPLQKARRSKFLEAVAYAKAAIADPEKAAYYKQVKREHQSVYHAALSDFMNTHSY